MGWWYFLNHHWHRWCLFSIRVRSRSSVFAILFRLCVLNEYVHVMDDPVPQLSQTLLVVVAVVVAVVVTSITAVFIFRLDLPIIVAPHSGQSGSIQPLS